MKKSLKNTKAQFFIVAAVIIVATLSGIFYYMAQVNQVSNPNLVSTDESFFINNVQNEYGKTVELVLSNFSREESVDISLLTNSLNNLTDLVRNISSQKGIYLNISTALNQVSNASVNVSINLTGYAGGQNFLSNFDAVRAINVTIDPNSFQSVKSLLAYNCSFNFTVKKEYSEPILFLNETNFNLGISTSPLLIGYKSYGKGIYGAWAVFLGTNCNNKKYQINVTDHRNILGYDTYQS